MNQDDPKCVPLSLPPLFNIMGRQIQKVVRIYRKKKKVLHFRVRGMLHGFIGLQMENSHNAGVICVFKKAIQHGHNCLT